MSNVSQVISPKTPDGKSYFLHLAPNSVPGYVIVPGSPERISKIMENWQDVQDLGENRHYVTKSGVYEGMLQGASSTGIGALSAEICFNELRQAGAHTCLRVGSTGCLDGEYDIADLIIPVACIRKDGSSECYIEPEYPSYADPLVVMALAQACEKFGYKYGLGLEYTAGSFYMGQGRPLNDDGSGYLPSWVPNIIPDIEQARVKVLEMDTAGQFVIGALQGLRMGAILTVVANRVHNTFGYKDGEEKACRAASEALKILADWDQNGIS